MRAKKREDRDHADTTGDRGSLADLDRHTLELLRQEYGRVEPDPERDHRRHR